jgi:hypothetical protein
MDRTDKLTEMEARAKVLGLDPQETQIFLLGAKEFAALTEKYAHAGEYAGDPRGIYVFEMLYLLNKKVE